MNDTTLSCLFFFESAYLAKCTYSIFDGEIWVFQFASGMHEAIMPSFLPNILSGNSLHIN